MEELPSEKDSPETLKAKMSDAGGNNPAMIPVPNAAGKFGKSTDGASNPFGFGEEDVDNYWALEESAERLKVSNSFSFDVLFGLCKSPYLTSLP